MQTFLTGRDAKEFLANRIVMEAEQRDVPLSEVERKILYFSETAWTLPDIIEINATFDRDYDQEEYEQKIADLIRTLFSKVRANGNEMDTWREAVRTSTAR